MEAYPNTDCLLKLGRHGSAYVYESGDIVQVPAITDQDDLIIDTAAAGDCFNGAYLTKYIEKASVEECLKFANRAAFLSITKKGTMESLPS
jgi:ribokinase